MWLLVRVAMQLIISRSSGSSEPSRDLYKTFMVFLMGHILELSRHRSLPSDLLYAMNAKLARRLLKLDPHVDANVFGFVQNTMQNTHKQICAKWSHILEQASPCYDLSCLKRLRFDQDIFNTLAGLEYHIKWLAKRGHHKSPLSFQPASHLTKYQAEELPTRLGFSIPEYTV